MNEHIAYLICQLSEMQHSGMDFDRVVFTAPIGRL